MRRPKRPGSILPVGPGFPAQAAAAAPGAGPWYDLLNPPDNVAAAEGKLSVEIAPRWARVLSQRWVGSRAPENNTDCCFSQRRESRGRTQRPSSIPRCRGIPTLPGSREAGRLTVEGAFDHGQKHRSKTHRSRRAGARSRQSFRGRQGTDGGHYREHARAGIRSGRRVPASGLPGGGERPQRGGACARPSCACPPTGSASTDSPAT